MSCDAAGRTPNALRGEASVLVQGERLILRPAFSALLAAEEELGPLFALVGLCPRRVSTASINSHEAGSSSTTITRKRAAP